MSNCVFCKIAGGELPSRKIYEDAHTLAFLDIAQDVDGHIVAIPKKHVESILDCGEETLCQLMRTVKHIAGHLTAHCGYDGVNLLNASGQSAGQSVPHFHIHIIPRKSGDGIDAWPELGGAKQDIDTVFSQIKIL